MPVVSPVSPDKAPDAIQSVYDRIKQTVGHGEVPLGFQLMGSVEPFLKDSYMNYRKFVVDGAGQLDARQRKAIALATSSAMNCTACLRTHAREAVEKQLLTDTEVTEVLAVTATCSMYNHYYKFRSLVEDSRFESYSVGLRAHTFARTSLDDQLVELINIVVSNIHSCPTCTSGHVQKALQLGLTHDQIDEAIKVSSVTVAFNVFHRTQ